jgi:hypothetical protein
VIAPADVQKLAAALHSSPYRFAGVCPASIHIPPPSSQPCALITDPQLTAFDYAMETAFSVWPNVDNWELIGSDEEITTSGTEIPMDPRTSPGASARIDYAAPESKLPPGARVLKHPVSLAAFRASPAIR